MKSFAIYRIEPSALTLRDPEALQTTHLLNFVAPFLYSERVKIETSSLVRWLTWQVLAKNQSPSMGTGGTSHFKNSNLVCT